ncbi:substrate-binding domain-containing protein [Pseudomonas sp. CF161]|uniref:ABC transporter substrate-binding protein n=1 Tax=Pseudomonas sp. CF161 TaxID=911241 RepID=UPI00035543F7|nr:substrate-binding domain-containing protein [Pseudomonas sp. CF161]EPL03437.1 putative sugar ABC transporter, substrate-binding protein [Pseudomonas sp. CF161]
MTMNVPGRALLLAVLTLGCASYALADEFVDQARQRISAATQPWATWEGPTTGPVAQADKQIVFVASDLRNSGVLGVSEGVQAATQVMGWKLRTLDGQGSVSGRTAALNQAIVLKPDGIILGGFDAREQLSTIAKVRAAGIPLLGWHAGPKAGAMPEEGLFVNITTDPTEVAKIAAYYAVAQSQGTAGVVILTDSLYAVATAKSDAMAEVIKQCAGCSLLALEDSPLAETSSRMPQLTTSLLQRFGERWNYTLGINDLYFDFIGPALSRLGRAPNQPPLSLSAGDGSESAYQRIRQSRYQAATVPEPVQLHGWQLVDELNRAFAGSPPSNYVTAVHLVTADNIKVDGGPRNTFDPDNGYAAAYRRIWQR